MKRSSVTIKDIARNLNVSHTTVSRVLSPGKGSTISEKTREMVMKEADRLGYQPNQAARALVTGRTGVLCLMLWTDGIHDDYHSRVIHEAHAAIQKFPFELCIVLASRRSLESGPFGPGLPMAVDGIILYEAAAFGAAVSEKYRGVPIVSAGAYQTDMQHDSVVVDLTRPTQDAVNHLIKQGRKKILYLGSGYFAEKGGPEGTDYIINESRHHAYDLLLKSAGLTPEYVHTERGKASARTRLDQYLTTHQPPDAIFCHSDEIAIGAYRALMDHGVKIPEQTALIGCDGLEDTEYIGVPISTTVQPLAQVMELAIESLMLRMESPNSPLRHIVIPGVFHPRKSSDLA